MNPSTPVPMAGRAGAIVSGSRFTTAPSGRMDPVPLSDEERRRLEMLEQELAATDPGLNLELQSGEPPGMAARAIIGFLVAVAGFAMIIAGIITQITITGVIGFLLMGAGAHWFLTGLRPLDGSGFGIHPQNDGKSSPSGPQPGSA